MLPGISMSDAESLYGTAADPFEVGSCRTNA